LSLVFHIVSAIAFLILMLWLVRLQHQISLLRAMIGEQSGRAMPVIVQWPDKFLQQFCQSLAIKLEIQAGPTGGLFSQPVRIRPKRLFSLHLKSGIDTISIRPSETGPVELEIMTTNELSEHIGNDMINSLHETLPGVVISVVSRAKPKNPKS